MNALMHNSSFFDAIDNYVKTEMNRLGIPGLALGIVYGNEIIHLQGFGVADSTGRTVMPQTPFHIGSMTKSFTALAVMQLVESSKIELDAPVQKYLPWFTLADKNASAQITVRHLLNQASGISTTDGNRFWNSTFSMEEAVRQMRTVQLAYPVGTKYQYCNMNYVILGLIVEKVSGQSYADYVNEHIFIPLDMRHAYTSHDVAMAKGLSAGHYYVMGHAYKREGIFPPAYIATGLMVSSVEDMTHYLIAQLNDGKYGYSSVLSPQGVTEMHAHGIPMGMGNYHYTMGWAAGSTDGVSIIKHSGDISSFHSVVMLLPEKKWGVVMLANASGFEQIQQLEGIAGGVISLLKGKQPAPVSLPFMFRFLYWGILLTPLLQILGISRGLLHWQNGMVSEPWQVIVTVILNLAIALFFLFKVPGLIPFPLSSLRAFYPELGYGLIGGGILGFSWSAVYLMLNLQSIGLK